MADADRSAPISTTPARGRLARRLILDFALGAILPVAVFGALAYYQVTGQLLDDVDRRLHQETKGVAMGVIERLLYLEASLDLAGHSMAGDEDALGPRIDRLVENQFASRLERLDPREETLGPRERAHLASGATSLVLEDTATPFGDASVVLVRRIDETTTIQGRVRPRYLWDVGPRGSLPPQVEFAVIEGETVLVRSHALPDDLPRRLAAVRDESSGQLEWRHEGTDYLASFWAIPMEANYARPPWVVILARERSLALAALDHFRLTFPLLVALTVWIVLLVTIRQIRAGLAPLSRLRDAMAKVGENDFDQRVELSTGDELEELATGFNAMTVQLGEQFATQKELTRALEAEHARLEDLVDQLPHGLLLLDCERRIVLANRLGREALRHLSDANPGPGDRLDRLGDMTLEDRTNLEGPVSWREIRSPGPDARLFVVGRGLVRSRDERPGSVVVLRDVTQEKALQDQFHRQERLAAVGQLAAGMAHDLNNTLQVILSAVQLLQIRCPDTADRRETAMILEQSRHGASLIRQVLDFSRSGPVGADRLDLRDMVAKILGLLRRMLPETIELVEDLPGHGVPIRGDATRLQQVFTNLILNARDAMPDGGRLFVTLRVGEDQAEVKLEDTGEGMTPEVRAKIFEPFFTTKSPGRGTGLGLAQVYGIVDAHGGRIEVESELGIGTRFRIFLPLGDEGIEREPERESRTEARGRRERILVVEDQEVVREIVRAALEALGYEILTARDGVDALAHLEATDVPPALVISDIVMPEMGGRDLVAALQDLFPELPVILMSGYSDEDAESLCRLPGVAGLLRKPVALDDLASQVEATLESRARH